jgi:selenocysteine-specific elongation factor
VETAPPEDGTERPRVHIDRSFTIKGAGTVVTGTLTDGELKVGEEVVILPSGEPTRIRSLQTHRRSVDIARSVSRVAANVAGIPQEGAARGDVLVRPGEWRPTVAIDVLLRPVRSVTRPLTQRGAYKLHVGSAERDAAVRFHDATSVEPGAEAFARLRLSSPVVVRFCGRRGAGRPSEAA